MSRVNSAHSAARDQRAAGGPGHPFLLVPGPALRCGDPEVEEPGGRGVGALRATCLSGLIARAQPKK